MTRKRYLNAKCPSCNIDAICPLCNSKIPSSTPFSDWLRKLEHPLDSSIISLHNLDYIWHNYRENWFITIEEKRFGAKPAPSQKDTLRQLSQLLIKASGSNVTNSLRNKEVKLEYRGHYYIIFEKTSPEDSAWVEINGRKIGNEIDNPYAKTIVIGQAIKNLLKCGRFPMKVEHTHT